jgi:CRP/FNR family transcriptional regulator, cyclic AMP receptor protein
MHLPTKQSDLMSELAAKLRALTELLCTQVTPADEPFAIAASDDIFADIPPTRTLLIVEGQVDYYLHNKLVMHFEAGACLDCPAHSISPKGNSAAKVR